MAQVRMESEDMGLDVTFWLSLDPNYIRKYFQIDLIVVLRPILALKARLAFLYKPKTVILDQHIAAILQQMGNNLQMILDDVNPFAFVVVIRLAIKWEGNEARLIFALMFLAFWNNTQALWHLGHYDAIDVFIL